MKDSEFIELLNLYLDHEISATDAVRIEAEVQQNPARRRIYRDYCRLQKACTLLAKDYAGQATATRSSEDRQIAAFEPHRAWGTGIYLGGLAVAAACIALVLVNRSSEKVPAAGTASASVALSPAPATSASAVDVKAAPPALADSSAKRAIAQTVTLSSRHSELKPVFSATSLALPNGNANDAVLLATAGQDASQAQFDWMRSVQLSPVQRVQVDDFRFEPKANLKPNSRTFGPGRLQTPVENAAWQFQR